MANNVSTDIQKETQEPKAASSVKGVATASTGKDYYFGDREEQAFIKYCQLPNGTERSRLFSEILYPAFTKMVESIIRTYHLFTPDEDLEETFCATMSFLITKIDNYDVSKGYKAYSYCGTVCKNYLIYRRDNAMKHQKKYSSLQDIFGVMDAPGLNADKYGDPNKEIIEFSRELIDSVIWNIQDMLNPEKNAILTDEERMVGFALLELLMNWEEIFTRMGSNKFNKTSFFYFLREATHLETPDIRKAMRKYKELFQLLKEDLRNRR